MTDSLAHGLALVLGAGACQGTFMLPTKWIKGWVWENYWLIFASTAYLACPWILALATIPRLFDVYAGASDVQTYDMQSKCIFLGRTFSVISKR